MSNQLPPSKFGAGYTYGGDQPEPTQRIQQPPPPPSYDPGSGNAPTTAYPTYPQGPDPYAGGQYGQPTAQYAPPPQYGQAPQQYSAPAPGYQPGPSGSGGGAIAGSLAIIAGLANAAWAIPLYFYLGKATRSTSDILTGGSSSGPWQAKFTIYSAFAQTAFGVLLLIGGMLLLAHKGSGKVLAALSSFVVVVIGIASVVIGYQYGDELTGGDPNAYKLTFSANPAFFWFDPDKMTEDSLSSNFTIECIAFGVLMVFSIAALIGALMTKTGQRTAALASAPYGY
jgi:hypothetical protein